MIEPDFTNPEDIKKQFYHLISEADFDRMGPWLIYILKNRNKVDIPIEHIRDAFSMVIEYRLNDGRIKEALQHMARLGSIGEITPNHRRKLVDTLLNYILNEEDQLVKSDWSELMKFLRRQIKFLQVSRSDKKLTNHLISLHETIDYKMKFASEAEESPMREYIQGFMSLFYSHLPTEEAADY